MKKFLFMLLLTHAACAMDQNFNPYESGSGTRIENLRKRLMKSKNLNLNDSIEIKQHYQSFQNIHQGGYNWAKYFQGSQSFQNLTGLVTDLLVYKNFKPDQELLKLLNTSQSFLSNRAEVIKKNEEEARKRGRLALQKWEKEHQKNKGVIEQINNDNFLSIMSSQVQAAINKTNEQKEANNQNTEKNVIATMPLLVQSKSISEKSDDDNKESPLKKSNENIVHLQEKSVSHNIISEAVLKLMKDNPNQYPTVIVVYYDNNAFPLYSAVPMDTWFPTENNNFEQQKNQLQQGIKAKLKNTAVDMSKFIEIFNGSDKDWTIKQDTREKITNYFEQMKKSYANIKDWPINILTLQDSDTVNFDKIIDKWLEAYAKLPDSIQK